MLVQAALHFEMVSASADASNMQDCAGHPGEVVSLEALALVGEESTYSAGFMGGRSFLGVCSLHTIQDRRIHLLIIDILHPDLKLYVRFEKIIDILGAVGQEPRE